MIEGALNSPDDQLYISALNSPDDQLQISALNSPDDQLHISALNSPEDQLHISAFLTASCHPGSALMKCKASERDITMNLLQNLFSA